jgi:hypothetical protein
MGGGMKEGLTRKPADIDYRPITPPKVEAWVKDLEAGKSRPGFLAQLVEAYRELYFAVHGPYGETLSGGDESGGDGSRGGKNQLTLF